MDVQVAGKMRVSVNTVRRMCGRSRDRGKAFTNAFENFLEFCDAIEVDPVFAFAEMIKDVDQ